MYLLQFDKNTYYDHKQAQEKYYKLIKTELKKSAELYAEIYDQDEKIKFLTESALNC